MKKVEDYKKKYGYYPKSQPEQINLYSNNLLGNIINYFWKIFKSFHGENWEKKRFFYKKIFFIFNNILFIIFTKIPFYIKNLFRINSLHTTGKVFMTDKYRESHSFNNYSYLDIYERFLKKFKNKKINLLEIGVKDGESLRMWKSYFKRSKIYGIDINPTATKYEENRIKIFIGSQNDKSFLNKISSMAFNLDVIIDDGSHVNEHILTSFNSLFYDKLKPGGYYIIEDLACSYRKLQSDEDVYNNWAGFSYNDPDGNYDNNRQDLNDFFTNKIYDLDHQKGKIASISFYSMICIIEKCNS